MFFLEMLGKLLKATFSALIFRVRGCQGHLIPLSPSFMAHSCLGPEAEAVSHLSDG